VQNEAPGGFPRNPLTAADEQFIAACMQRVHEISTAIQHDPEPFASLFNALGNAIEGAAVAYDRSASPFE